MGCYINWLVLFNYYSSSSKGANYDMQLGKMIHGIKMLNSSQWINRLPNLDST
jgi:hypothetical protein